MVPQMPAPQSTLELPPVYPITDKLLARRDSHMAIVRELVRGGATLIQVRDKETPVSELLADLRRCVEYCLIREVTLIVNDRVDLALCSGASGVHLGQEDLPPSAAREILGPGKIIGYSTNTSAQVRQTRKMPIQYIGVGPIFPTSTRKNPSPVVGIEGLRTACIRSSWPVVAIGGIALKDVRRVLAAGAASLAVISAIMRATSPAKQMEMFLREASDRERGLFHLKRESPIRA
jgi:thiamine-phosphate pyrophosphorylase